MAKKRRNKKRKGCGSSSGVQQQQPPPPQQSSQNGAPNNNHNQQYPTAGTMTSENGATGSSNMSTEGSRLSSDVAETEGGTHTEMTSVVGSEDVFVTTSVSGLGDDITDEATDEAVDDTAEAAEVMSDGNSTYAPPSEYPTVPMKHRTETLYGADQDIDMLSTRSITEQDLDYRWENGRRYCGPVYAMPNDEFEQARLNLLHRVWLDMFDDELTSVPLDDPDRILDVGTGIGEWAIGMADLYPDCEVIGTDISAIQPTSVPTNCFFEIDDAELEWTRETDSFDLVHLRDIIGAITDWPKLYHEAYRVIKPGGWIEVADFDDSVAGLSKIREQFPPGSDAHILGYEYPRAAAKSGRKRGLGHLNPAFLHQAGFVDIQVTDHMIPINMETGGGKFWLIAFVDGLEALMLRLLTQQLGWEPERAKDACYNVARELAQLAKDPVKCNELGLNVRVVIGRKSLNAEPTKPRPHHHGERYEEGYWDEEDEMEHEDDVETETYTNHDDAEEDTFTTDNYDEGTRREDVNDTQGKLVPDSAETSCENSAGGSPQHDRRTVDERPTMPL